MRFEFATAQRILFGEGTLAEVAPAAASMGKRALLVTGRSAARAAPLAGALERAGLAAIPFAVEGEPSVATVGAGVELARGERCDLVLALGGGSAIDGGKAIAAMLANPGDLLDYLEVVGRGLPLEKQSAPFIAIPTTAGTGSEVTRNAVLASAEQFVKASLRSPHMLPRLALIDPQLTYELPPQLTASTGLDALTQLIEPYVSARSNPLTDLYCVEGMRAAAQALPRVWNCGSDREARSAMSWAALLGGFALANAGLGAVHGFAAPIGGLFPAPHGAVCAAVLPHAMAINLEALRRRAPGSSFLQRYDEVGRLVTGWPQANAQDGVDWVTGLCRALEIPTLRSYGVSEADVPGLVTRAAAASSMKANPIPLTPEELTEIVLRAL